MASIENTIISAILNLIRTRRGKRRHAKDTFSLCSTTVPPAVLREAQFSDFEQVAALKQCWGLSHDSVENWERLWRNNPALQGAGVERPIGWVLEADGHIVGYLGNIFLLYQYGDKTLTAVASHGLVVDPKYRSLSFSLVNAFYRQESVDLYVVTTAIKAVGKLSIAYGSVAMPQPHYDTVLFWVLRPYSFARAMMKKLKVSPFLSPPLNVLAALAIAGEKVVRRRWPKLPSPMLTITEITPAEIGREFEALWREKIRERPRLFADRCAATLRWHFDIPGDKGIARVLCHREKGRLNGYAIVRTDTDTQNGLRKSSIADLIAQQDDPEVIRSLCAAAYRHAMEQGSHILEMEGFPPEVRDVCSGWWRPYLRTIPACPYYYKARSREWHNLLKDARAWYASPFDGDASLIRPSYSSLLPQTNEPSLQCAHAKVAVHATE